VSVNPGIVYREVIRAPQATVAHQRLAFNWGIAHKDWPLLVALQELESLDPTIDAKLALVPNASVQAAHVARPGRDMGVLSDLAVSDTRVSVHKFLAGVRGLRSDAYDVMAESDSRAVAIVLVANPDARIAARRKAARLLASRIHDGTHAEKRRFEELFLENPEVADDLIIGAVTGRSKMSRYNGVLPLLLRYSANNKMSVDDLGPAALDALVKNLAEHLKITADALLRDTTRSGYESRSHEDWYRNLIQVSQLVAVCPSLLDEHRARLLSALDIDPRPDVFKNHSSPTKIEPIIDLLKNPPSEDLTILTKERVHKTHDAEALAEMVDQFDPAAVGASAVALALIANPDSTGSMVKRVLSKVHHSSSRLNLRTIIDQRISNPDVVIEMFCVDSSIITDERLDATGDRTRVLQEIVRRHGTLAVGSIIKFLDVDSIGPVKGSDLEKMDNSYTDPRFRELVAEYLVRGLGEDPRKWALFDTIIETAPGSLEDIVRQVNTLRRIEK
jgi:hypothetical protein